MHCQEARWMQWCQIYLHAENNTKEVASYIPALEKYVHRPQQAQQLQFGQREPICQVNALEMLGDDLQEQHQSREKQSPTSFSL